jgi:signal transduction histidine kinase
MSEVLRKWIVAFLAIIPWNVTWAVENNPPVLTSVREIRNLSVAEARSGLPVRLKAVVIFSRLEVAALFVHDGEGGIYVEQPSDYSNTGPKLGDLVEIAGSTGEGLFAPVIRRNPDKGEKLTILGPGVLPPPKVVTGDELSLPGMDCERVSVEARILEVTMNGDGVAMECEAGPCNFSVVLQGPVSPDSVPWDLAESQVRILGVAATAFNANRQMTRRLVRVSSLADIQPLDHGLISKSPPKLVRADSLFQLSGPGTGDLVRLVGITTLPIPGRGIYLRAPEGGIWVQTAQPIDAPPGTVVEVEGWPRLREMKPFLRARSVNILNTGRSPEPQPLNARQALHARYDSELISVQAELLDTLVSADGTTLVLRGGGVIFNGLLGRSARDSLPELRVGSKLEVSGIALVSSVDAFAPMQEEDKLSILLRSPADVVLVSKPPWWTATRVSVAATLTLAAILGIYLIARSRRLREAATKHREFEAVLAERGRFAREIHDSLAQGLTSISLQLECARDEIQHDAPKLRSHVETARRLVRDSLSEARRTVWNLRPLALGEADLASALQRFASDLTRDGRISCRQEIEGTPRPLPPDHEAALLRIGQEALTNAVRHANPSELLLRLRFGADWITLTVRDNGRGFDVAALARKGFGLTGMQERVTALGGSVSIDSQPTDGTEVSATLPT